MNNDRSKKIPTTVIMLGLVSLFTDAASEMIYPLIPLYVAFLGSGALILGLIEGVAETTAAMLKLVSGILSDAVGKRKLLVLIGYSISTIARPFTGIVANSWQIIFIRMLDRVGKGVRSAPRDALIASSVNDTMRGKAYGFHRAMDHLGAVIGPILAIMTLLLLIQVFEMKDSLLVLRWTFILSIVPGFFAVLTIIFFVKEYTPQLKKTELFTFSLRNFDNNFKNYLMILMIFTLGNSSDAFLLFQIQEAVQSSGAVTQIVNSIKPLREMVSIFGDTQHQTNLVNMLFLPIIWSFFHCIKVAFSTYLGALSDKIGRKITICIGWGIYSFVYMSFAFLTVLPKELQIGTTCILMGVYALFYAFSEGAEKAFVADIVHEKYRGSAFGMYNFVIGIGALPASIIFGMLYSFFNKKIPGLGGIIAFGFGATLALVSCVLLLLVVKEPSNYNKQDGV